MRYTFIGTWEGKTVYTLVTDLQSFVNSTPDSDVFLYTATPNFGEDACLGPVPKVQVEWESIELDD